MIVYRADEPDLTPVPTLVGAVGSTRSVGALLAGVVYVVVNSTRPDLPALAMSVGPSYGKCLT